MVKVLETGGMGSPGSSVSEASRWQAIVQRDPAASGTFVYGVSTTGIYCRPGCASRLPRREHVQFFDTWQTAEQAGFRPCKRCAPHLPEGPDASMQAILRACRIIETVEEPPTLQKLADAVGLSPYHFHRLFRQVMGITPRQYAAEKRMERVRADIRRGATITDAVYNAGFGSSSRFYERATASLGMKPSEYRKGGMGMVIRYAIAPSYLGLVLVAATDRGICQISFGDSPETLRALLESNFPRAELVADDSGLREAVTQVLALLEQPQRGLALPLDIQGTAFQRQVWAALQQIPAGSTVSYSDIAARIGHPKAMRAVASACASNKIAVVIPCHRVIRRDGDLGGYRWGLGRKRALLERESGAHADHSV